MGTGGRAWVGRASKRRLALGWKVHVIVTSVNPIEGLVDLTLVEVEEGKGPKMQRSPQKSTQRPAHRPAQKSRHPSQRRKRR